MKTYADFPNLCDAIRLVFSDNSMPFKADWEKTAVRAENLAEIQIAEASAAMLKGHPLGAFIPEEMIDPELEQADTDALEVLAVGEDTAAKQLAQMVAGGEELASILCNAFEGPISNDLSG